MKQKQTTGNATLDVLSSVRRRWDLIPHTRFHSATKGKRVYDRKENRRIERDW